MSQWDYRAGAGAAVVAVPAGRYLSSVSATAVAAGATVQVGAGAAIPVPVNGSITANSNRGKVGPFNVTFVGTAQYFVDWFDSPF